MENLQPIRVLIIDDSLVSREVLRKGLGGDRRLQVVGVAGDPYEAVEKIETFEPDVLTLDINMPKMDGLTFLTKLMAQLPLPVVVISSSADRVFDAMERGAVDFVAKPAISSPADLKAFLKEVVEKVKVAAMVKTHAPVTTAIPEETTLSVKAVKDIRVIAMGASTGGTDALLKVLKGLPQNVPGIVIVQHMPPVFTRMYAERLDQQCALSVSEAKTGDEIKPGKVLLAPGDQHLKVVKDQQRYVVRCFRGHKVSGHCPSVDVLFESVALTAGEKAMGVLLTGMGSDGARGLLTMRKAGAHTLGQDKESSVVYGMPMVAYNIGAVVRQSPLDRIPSEILRYLSR
ncbi:protein-glutamate methylesterase/protein-glutamine glutaminase [Anoxynatronum buryatiense]|uniref:Protein-glutamate methylesterase/protein-glutamine glutaminase n=1 Tax=Anoxynatronum buryatiense TaxID=489973 RepID=A0AA45WTK0_9CLOT|nr:chemotaxis response regulator protein-glutamate methylesterase [Anoxynatronum buryatiense]SMP43434.1 two-component system, chemotaxis family, response regulator CheB [Anoxynatronum buryatiense]